MFRKFSLLVLSLMALLVMALPASAEVKTNGFVGSNYWAIIATANPATNGGAVGSVVTFDVQAINTFICNNPPCAPEPATEYEVTFEGIFGADAAKFAKTGGDVGAVVVDDVNPFTAIITCDTSAIGTFTAQIGFRYGKVTLNAGAFAKTLGGAAPVSYATITCIVTEDGAMPAPVTSENTETGAPLRVYCSASGKTFFIYRSVGNVGELDFITTEAEIDVVGVPTGNPVIIEENTAGDIVLYRLSNGRYLIQMFVPDPVIGGKVYSFVWGPCAYGQNGAIGFFTP
jgi:hypothetical protein